MDAIDLKLITLLQKNARTPLKVLASQVFLSSPVFYSDTVCEKGKTTL